MDSATAALLVRLRPGPTDLARVVERVLRGRAPVVTVTARAVSRWERDAPHDWTRTRAWLAARGVALVVTTS